MDVYGNVRDFATARSRHTMWFVALVFGIPGKTVSCLLLPKPLEICTVHTRVHCKDVQLEEN